MKISKSKADSGLSAEFLKDNPLVADYIDNVGIIVAENGEKLPPAGGGVFPADYKPVSLRCEPHRYEEVYGHPPDEDFKDFAIQCLVDQKMRANEQLAKIRKELRDQKSHAGKRSGEVRVSQEERDLVFAKAKELRPTNSQLDVAVKICETWAGRATVAVATVHKWVGQWDRAGLLPLKK